MTDEDTDEPDAYGCEACGEEVETIVDIIQHDCNPVRLSAPRLTRKERNTLLYIETRTVDNGGKLNSSQMNHVDHQNIKVFEAAGLLEVSDAMRDPDNPREDTVQVEAFTDEAWDLARDCRQLRALDDDRVDFPVGERPEGIHTLPADGVVGECFQCGVDIEYGEWHVALDSDSRQVPRDTKSSVQTSPDDHDDDTRRLCGPCSGRDREDFPDDRPIAGL